MPKLQKAILKITLLLICGFASYIFLQAKLAADSNQYEQYELPLNGHFSIDPQGNSNYSLPIKVPPGILKVVPKISFIYNSGYRNSFVSKGWRLSGLSHIRLCSLNYFFDKTWSNVKINDSNAKESQPFCLDNQRLVSINGDYGQDGTEYRTEIFNKMRIISHGRCGNGPCYFEAWTRDGGKRVYGNTVDSVVKPGSKPEDIIVWGLSKATDINSNSINYIYKASVQDENILYPSEIHYVENKKEKINSSSFVKFDYKDSKLESNPQKKFLALTGDFIHQSKVLSTVSTYNQDKLVLSYILETEMNKLNQAYLLKSITLCDNSTGLVSGNCYKPTTFSYDDENPVSQVSFKKGSTSILQSVKNPKSVQFKLMDKYSTGFLGLGIISEDNGKALFNFHKNDGTGKFTKGEDADEMGSWGYDSSDLTKSYDYHILDKNGDGISDLIKIYKNSSGGTSVQVYINEFRKPNFTTGKNQILDNKYQPDGDNKNIYIATDISGDGLSDVVRMSPSNSSTYEIKSFESSADGGFPKSQILTTFFKGYRIPFIAESVNFLDIDGDSMVDMYALVKTNPTSTKRFGISGLSFYHRKNSFVGPESSEGTVDFGNNGDWETMPIYKWIDFNKDGLKDVLLITYKEGQKATGKVWINTGLDYQDMFQESQDKKNKTTTFEIGDFAGTDKSLYQNIIIGDINGDGRDDILKYLGNPEKNTGKSVFELYTNNGVTFNLSSSTVDLGSNTRNYPMDLNGDGVLDILSVLVQDNGTIQSTSWMNQTRKSYNQLQSIQNGIGRQIKIGYDQLSKVHQIEPDNFLGYPYILYSQPRQVVASYSESNFNDSASSLLQTNLFNSGYKREFKVQYTNGMVNRSNWKFLGFQKVEYQDLGRDISTVRSYHLKHPLAGSLKSIVVSTLGSNNELSSEYMEYNVEELHGDTTPTVKLIQHTVQKNSSYYQTDSGESQEIFTKESNFFYAPLSDPDGRYGNIISKSVKNTAADQSSDTLYHCYLYINKEDKTNWAIGYRTADKISQKSSCSDFKKPSTYKWDSKQDLRMKVSKYDLDTLKVNFAGSYYYNKDKPLKSGWIGRDFTYKGTGLVNTVVFHSGYLGSIGGKYSAKDKSTTIQMDYDENQFLKTQTFSASDTKEEILRQFVIDPRFGLVTRRVHPNSSVLEANLNSLGLAEEIWGSPSAEQDSTQSAQLVMLQKIDYIIDSDTFQPYQFVQSKVNWGDEDHKNWDYEKKYYDGLNKFYQIRTKSSSGDQDIVHLNIEFDAATGRTTKRSTPYLLNDKDFSYYEYEYDSKGRVNKLTAPDKSVTTYAHNDQSGQSVVKITMPSPALSCDASTEKSKMAASKTDEISFTKSWNHLNRVHTITDPNMSVFSKSYDFFHNQIQYTDPRKLAYDWNYDSLGRMYKHTNPDTGKEERSYNGTSHVVTYLLGDDRNINLDYDGLGRLVSRVATNSATKDVLQYSYQYSEDRPSYYNKGFLTSVTTDKAQYEYNYNLTGDIKNKQVSISDLSHYKLDSMNFDFKYNVLKQKETLTYPDKTQVQWGYYPNGQLQNISYIDLKNKTQPISTFSNYDAFGLAQNIAYGNSLSISQNSDQTGRLSAYSATNKEKDSLIDFNLCYNKSGLLTQKTTGGKVSDIFTYNTLGQLNYSKDASSNEQNFNYDVSGNLVQNGDISFEIDPKKNQVSSSSSSKEKFTLNYDSFGRLTEKKSQNLKSNGVSYLYNPLGRLNAYKSNDVSINYTYGLNGHQLTKQTTQKSDTEDFYFPTPSYEVSIANKNKKNITFKKHIIHSNVPLASLSTSGATSNWAYFLRDHLGSLVATTSASGEIVGEKISYQAYGQSVSDIKNGTTPEFTGKKKEPLTNLYNFVNRYYDPSLGRFLTGDPLRQKIGSYSYSTQPQNQIDITGLEFGEIISFISFLFGLAAVETAAAETASIATAAAATTVTSVAESVAVESASVTSAGVIGGIATAEVGTAIVEGTVTESILGVGVNASINGVGGALTSSTIISATSEAVVSGITAGGASAPVVSAGAIEASVVPAEGSALAGEAAAGEAAAGEAAAGEAAAAAVPGRLIALAKEYVKPAISFLAAQLIGIPASLLPFLISKKLEKHTAGGGTPAALSFSDYKSHSQSQASNGFSSLAQKRSPAHGVQLLSQIFSLQSNKKTSSTDSIGTFYGTGYTVVLFENYGDLRVFDPDYEGIFNSESNHFSDYRKRVISKPGHIKINPSRPIYAH